MWAWMGFCHAPTISPTAPFVVRLTQPAQTTWAISGTECSVHWALFGASGLLSTSVPLHLQTTIGHQEAPRRPQYYPKGIVGNLALRNKWGFLQEHGHWDKHLGHRAPVRSTQIKPSLFVLLNIADAVSMGFSHTHLHGAIKWPITLIKAFIKMKVPGDWGFCHLKVPNHVDFRNIQWQSALINEPVEFSLR